MLFLDKYFNQLFKYVQWAKNKQTNKQKTHAYKAKGKYENSILLNIEYE